MNRFEKGGDTYCCRLKNIDKTRNYFTEQLNQNRIISKEHRTVFKNLNDIEHLLILASSVIVCVSISGFASLVDISKGILKVCAIAAGIKSHKTIIKKEKNKHGQIVLLAKNKLNTMKVLHFRAFFVSYIKYDDFVSVNNLLKEYDDMKEEMKKSVMKIYQN